MNKKISTIYTKKRLIDLNYYGLLQKKILWILLAACTIVSVAMYFVVVILSNPTTELNICVSLLLGIDILFAATYLFLPRIGVNKSKTLNLELTYEFCEKAVKIECDSSELKENVTLKYSYLHHVGVHKNDVYLFINSYNAYIVDVAELSDEEKLEIRELLTSKLGEKKVKWKLQTVKLP